MRLVSSARPRRFVATLALAVGTVAWFGCSFQERPDSQGRVTLQGTVHSVQASDGTQCWRFRTEKGKDYELQPAQVPPSLLVDGQQATLLARPRPSGGSFCKVGEIVDVVEVNPDTTHRS